MKTSWQVILVAALAVAVSLLLLLQIYHLSLFRGSPDPDAAGDVATWFTGVATVAAVSVALAEASRSRRNEQRRQQDVERDVLAWLELQPTWLLCLQNRSGRSVAPWTLDFESGAHVCWRTVGPIPPGRLDVDLADKRGMPEPEPHAFPEFKISFVTLGSRVWSRTSTGDLVAAQSQEQSLLSHDCRQG